MSDLRTLIDRSIGGDMDAFSELMLRYQNAVYSIALSALGDFMLAEDVTQEVFISVYQNLFALGDVDNFPRWLRAITMNMCRTFIRERQKGVEIPTSPSSFPIRYCPPSAEREIEEKERHVQLNSALRALPEEQRRILLLRYMEEMSYDEMAQFLGISRSAVESKLYRARKALQDEMLRNAERQLRSSRLSERFTERVRREITERFLLMEESEIDISPDDTLVIYHDLGAPDTVSWAPLKIIGSDEGMFILRRSFLGRSTDEARGMIGNLNLILERRSGDLLDEITRGNIWSEAVKDRGEIIARYKSRLRFIQELGEIFERSFEEANDALREVLSGEAVLLSVRTDLPSAISVHPDDAGRFFRPFILNDRRGIGPPMNVEMTLRLPPCRRVVVIGNGIVGIREVKADLLLVGDGMLQFIADDVKGSIEAYGAIPIRMKGIRGDVTVRNPFYRHGVVVKKGTVSRFKMPATTSRIRDIGGDLRMTLMDVDLSVRNVRGEVEVENPFGSTEMTIPRDPPKRCEIRSVSGPISIRISKEADERISVGMWSECGAIHLGEWGKSVYRHNDAFVMYVGSALWEEAEGADLKARTVSGEIRICHL